MQEHSEKPMITRIAVAACMTFVAVLSTFNDLGIHGIIPLIQKHYGINDAEISLIMTSTSITHTITLGFVWILGDSFKRRRLFLVSVTAWILFSLLSIAVGSETFLIFVIFRALAGAASSVFGVLNAVVLSDLFQDRALGIALTCMVASEMIAILSAGIISSWIVTSDSIPWQSSLIAYPSLAIIAVIVLLFLKGNIRNAERPERGMRRIFASAFGIFSIKSYLLMIAISSLGALQGKAYAFWFPSTYLLAWTNKPEIFFGLSYTAITSINSAVMMIGTFIGWPTVLWFAQSWRHGTGPFSGRNKYVRAYPIVVAVGAALNSALFVLNLMMMDKSYVVSLMATFFIGVIRADGTLSQQMTLAILPSASRASAIAVTKLIVGVVSTPAAQIVGMISDAIRGDSTLPYDKFHAYQLGMLSSSVFLIASVLCNIAVIFFFPGDCKKAEAIDKEAENKPMDEQSLLNGKGRSESILETFARSRTATVNSLY